MESQGDKNKDTAPKDKQKRSRDLIKTARRDAAPGKTDKQRNNTTSKTQIRDMLLYASNGSVSIFTYLHFTA